MSLPQGFKGPGVFSFPVKVIYLKELFSLSGVFG